MIIFISIGYSGYGQKKDSVKVIDINITVVKADKKLFDFISKAQQFANEQKVELKITLVISTKKKEDEPVWNHFGVINTPGITLTPNNP